MVIWGMVYDCYTHIIGNGNRSSEFFHYKRWFSIVMSVYQRVRVNACSETSSTKTDDRPRVPQQKSQEKDEDTSFIWSNDTFLSIITITFHLINPQKWWLDISVSPTYQSIVDPIYTPIYFLGTYPRLPPRFSPKNGKSMGRLVVCMPKQVPSISVVCDWDEQIGEVRPGWGMWGNTNGSYSYAHLLDITG